MIIVVEGISASGKTSWCVRHGAGHLVPENTHRDSPDDPCAAADFWTARNAERWQAALAMERATDLAVCDTDPLKLHYIWCLYRIGEAREEDWRLQLAATRDAIRQQRLGFADCYLVNDIAPDLARERARADPARQRRRFELHVRLQPLLMEWYRTLDTVLPGRVQFGFPAAAPAPAESGERYDLGAFDRMTARLSRPA